MLLKALKSRLQPAGRPLHTTCRSCRLMAMIQGKHVWWLVYDLAGPAMTQLSSRAEVMCLQTCHQPVSRSVGWVHGWLIRRRAVAEIGQGSFQRGRLDLQRPGNDWRRPESACYRSRLTDTRVSHSLLPAFSSCSSTRLINTSQWCASQHCKSAQLRVPSVFNEFEKINFCRTVGDIQTEFTEQ